MEYTIQMVKAKETKNKVKYEAVVGLNPANPLPAVISEVYVAKTAFPAAYPTTISITVKL